MMSESQLQSKILKWLRKEFPKAATFKLHEDSIFGSVGLPDILFIWDGDVYFFEVKTENGVLAHIQKVVIDKIRDNRIQVNVVTNLEQVKEIIGYQESIKG